MRTRNFVHVFYIQSKQLQICKIWFQRRNQREYNWHVNPLILQECHCKNNKSYIKVFTGHISQGLMPYGLTKPYKSGIFTGGQECFKQRKKLTQVPTLNLFSSCAFLFGTHHSSVSTPKSKCTTSIYAILSPSFYFH